MAEICREYNLVPRTVYGWKEKFLAGGRISLDGPDASKQAKRHKKEIASLRRIIGGRAPAEAAGIEMRGYNRWLTDTELRRRGIGSVFTYIACGAGRTLPHMSRKPRQTVGIGVELCQKLAENTPSGRRV